MKNPPRVEIHGRQKLRLVRSSVALRLRVILFLWPSGAVLVAAKELVQRHHRRTIVAIELSMVEVMDV